MVLGSIWEEFLKIVREEAGSRVVETWLKAVIIVRWDSINRTIYVQAPNSFVKEWVRTHYINLFNLHLGRLLNVDNIIIVFVDQPEAIEDKHQVKEVVKVEDRNNISNNSAKLPAKNNQFKSRGYINGNYQFNSFVIGPNNSLAYSAAYAVTQKPGTLYNPLFIYGESGLGKTHLLHAIGNQIKLNNKDAIVLYQTADRFVNEFINAIRFDKTYLFKEKYKDIDVLLIDDIQFISNKDQTQEAFFHIFNSLYESHKQIVFSSDSYPRDIQGLAQRLRSRLESGLVTDIHAPTIETKIAILKKKLELNNEVVPEDVLYFIASKVDSNVRELEGSLIRVLAFSNLTNQIISLELAKKVLNNVKSKSSESVTLAEIVKVVGKKYSYTLSDLQSISKGKELAFARQISMYLMKQLTPKSLQDIGLFLKRKNHSTVVHAVNKIQKMRDADPDFNCKVKQLEEELNH